MQSSASFIAIFSVWIAGIALILYIFLPSIISSRSAMQTYDSTYKDTALRKQMDIDDSSFISLSPLAIFDMLQN